MAAAKHAQQTVTPLGIPPIAGRWLLVARTDQMVAIVDTTLDVTHPRRQRGLKRTVDEATKFALTLAAEVKNGAR
jgi:hypothetical protein